MAYQVIARKYRPQRFEDVVGQEHVTKTLTHAIEQKRIAHAYLFCGPRGASNNGVEQVRELRETCKYVPAHSKFKIYIIDEVHMLSTAAFNALLKTLEEPPEHV